MEHSVVVDGRALAAEVLAGVRRHVRRRARQPHLTVFTCAPRFETQKYLALKKQKANEAGILVNVIEFEGAVATGDMVQSIARAAQETDAIVVQLPLPPHIDTGAVVASIPPELDADALNPKTTAVLPPVVAACRYILKTHGVDVSGKRAAVIGEGRLVGAPAASWLRSEGAHMTVLTEHSGDFSECVGEAELIVSGAGVPDLITPDMIAPGVVILDAGTSEEAGILRGDADPRCAEKASLFTPVPGGIGPVTVAMLLKNAVELAEK